MRCLRWILKIKRDDVREQRIRNSHVRKKFLNIETIENIISKRRLIFIEKIIRIPCKCVPSRLFFAIQMKNTVRQVKFYYTTEKKIFLVDPAGSFNMWARVAFDESRWIELVNNLESTQADWDDSDWKDNEPEENSNLNKSPPLLPPPPRSSYNHSSTTSSFLFNNAISNHFETHIIAITSCLKEEHANGNLNGLVLFKSSSALKQHK